MRGLCSVFLILTLNINISYGENETATNKTTVGTHTGKMVAPGVLMPKNDSPGVEINEKTPAELKSSVAAEKSKEKKNSIETNKPDQNNAASIIDGAQSKNAAAVKHNATGAVKSQENKETPNQVPLAAEKHNPSEAVKSQENSKEMPNPHLSINVEKSQPSPIKDNATAAIKTQGKSKEVPNPLPSISVEKNHAPTISESWQSDVDQVEYQQVLKRVDVEIENSVQTGFYILMGISVGALLFVCIKMNKLRLSRAERKYGVQGNRSNQELAPLPLSMEDPESDEEDQTLFDINRQQIRIF